MCLIRFNMFSNFNASYSNTPFLNMSIISLSVKPSMANCLQDSRTILLAFVVVAGSFAAILSFNFLFIANAPFSSLRTFFCRSVSFIADFVQTLIICVSMVCLVTLFSMDISRLESLLISFGWNARELLVLHVSEHHIRISSFLED